MKYIVYLLTAVLPAIKRVTGDTFMFQQDSAPVHQRVKRSDCWSAKPQTSSLRICGPPTALTSFWSITSSGGSCNSGSIRRRSRMWMNSRSNRLKSGLDWSGAEHYWHCYQRMEKTSACLCSREGPAFQTLTVAVEQRDIWINTVSRSDWNVNQMWSTRVTLIK